MKRLYVVLGIIIVVFMLVFGGWRLSKSSTFQFYGGLVTRVETEAPVVALTLDDGPTAAGTEFVLPLLDSLGVKATFFVMGRDLAQNPELGRRIVEAGHALGNHSYSHRHMALHSTSFIRYEIETTDSLIQAAGWTGEIYFRPPYGRRLFLLPRYLHQTGRPTLLWDIAPESYRDAAISAEEMAAHVAERVRPGSIILLHIMYASRSESRRALPLIIDQLRSDGYRFVTLPELLDTTDLVVQQLDTGQ